MIIGLLIQIAVIGLIAVAVVRAVRRHREEAVAGGELSIRRFFAYLMLFGSLVVTSLGLSGLLGAALSNAAARTTADIAVPLALTITGLPVFAALAVWTSRSLRIEAAERRTVGWGVYLNAALLTSLGFTVGSAFAVAGAAVQGDWEGFGAAMLAVWGAAWAGHWVVWTRVRPEVLTRLHIWIASTAGLWIGAVSAGLTIDALLERMINPGLGATSSAGWDELWIALCGVGIGGAVWAWHWLAHGLHAPHTEGWHGYVLLAGVAAGLVAAVAGAGYALYLVLEWLVGDPGAATARQQFADVSPAVGACAVGLASWRYHRAVVGPSAWRDRTEVDRIYDYLVAGIALVTMAVATSILVIALFEALTPIAAGASNTLVAAATLLAVGVPMWTVTWRRVQRLAGKDPAERLSITRRVYLFVVFGVGGMVAFGAAVSVLVAVFEALFEGSTAAALAGAVDLPVALLITAGGGAFYHWLVYRTEHHEAMAARRREILLVADGIDVADIARRANVRIRLLHRTDLPAGSTLDADAVVAAIGQTEGDHLMVLAEPGDVRVVPFE